MDAVGALHGLPIAHKDTHDTAGSAPPRFAALADYVPDRDDLIIERIRAAGAVTLGKTNVPEFAAGSHTFNPIFGATRNPYDPTGRGRQQRRRGGRAGRGMEPMADGSDMGGSLRNPASFCNVVGLRPSPGRVPTWPTWNALGATCRSRGRWPATSRTPRCCCR